jgi:ATP phosphoribosyltransferase
MAHPPLVLAVPKGRVLNELAPLLLRAGIDLSPLSSDTRQLVFDLPAPGLRSGALRVLLLRGGDVPTYVEHGVADVGVAGGDVLREHGADLYEPVDLGIGRCRLAVAEPVARPVDERAELHLRIATKYPHLTDRWLESRGLVAEVIPLSGSIELSAIVGLADRIVDLVSSGETLRQNGLREIATLLEVTSRLVVNRASLKLKRGDLSPLVDRIRATVATARPAPRRPGRRSSAAAP